MSDIVFDGLVFDRLRQIGDQSNRIAALESEVARLRLTDAEREAVEFAVAHGETVDAAWRYAMRGLLERLSKGTE